ncbi:hypothetical protein BHE74_00020190 [Ensete ventricosum]|nr:hypothetical protein BHE74_00020190 [Ensete ventricosum]
MLFLLNIILPVMCDCFCESSLLCMGTILLIICLLFLQRFGENVGQVMDPNHASMLKSAATPGQPSGYAYLT